MNPPLRIEDLPAPPPGRTGFPWTEGTPALPRTLPGGKAFPRISIVTPSYKQGQYLEETIRSVLLQGYPNLEYIVIDGGSPDNSVEIIQKYAPFLSFWISEPDSGQSNAINKGFAHTTGDIMGWLNSDDILLPNALYQIALTFVQKPQVQLVSGFRKNIDEQSRVISNFVRDNPTDYYMKHYCCIAQETTYWRRALWETLGPLDETLHFAMDYEFWLRALHKGHSVHLIPKYTGGFRDYAENKSSSWIDVYYRDINVLYKRYSMGKDEADVHAKLGVRWARRYQLYLEISKQSWTNHPRLVKLAWRLLEQPLLCDAILAIPRLRRRYDALKRTSIRSRFKRPSIRFSSISRGLMGFRSDSVQLSFFGDVREIPDQRMIDDLASNLVPVNTLAFGDDWYGVEFYRGELFRWSSGVGTIYVNNPSGNQNVLCFTVAPAVPSPKNWLEIIADNGDRLLGLQVHEKQVDVQIRLPVVTNMHPVRYQFHWLGPIAKGGNDHRQLAFRLLGIGWRNSASQLISTTNLLQTAVDLTLTKQANTLPPIRLLLSLARRWRSANKIMKLEHEVLRQVSNHLTDLEAEFPEKAQKPETRVQSLMDL